MMIQKEPLSTASLCSGMTHCQNSVEPSVWLKSLYYVMRNCNLNVPLSPSLEHENGTQGRYRHRLADHCHHDEKIWDKAR